MIKLAYIRPGISRRQFKTSFNSPGKLAAFPTDPKSNQRGSIVATYLVSFIAGPEISLIPDPILATATCFLWIDPPTAEVLDQGSVQEAQAFGSLSIYFALQPVVDPTN